MAARHCRCSSFSAAAAEVSVRPALSARPMTVRLLFGFGKAGRGELAPKSLL